MRKHCRLLIACCWSLAACSDLPPGVYYNRGDPENLLDVSSEVVNMNAASSLDLADLTRTLADDPPSRAELHCPATDKFCTQAKSLLGHYGVASKWAEGGHGVTLIYDRVMARDCENRYIDNSINDYNLNHPTFGCSMMANTVQMVSDKRQFVNPSLLDFEDGSKAVQAYEQYRKPSEASQGAGNAMGYTIPVMGGSGGGAGGR